MTLIQSCQLYLHWPKLSISHLADGTLLKTFPANQGKWPTRLNAFRRHESRRHVTLFSLFFASWVPLETDAYHLDGVIAFLTRSDLPLNECVYGWRALEYDLRKIHELLHYPSQLTLISRTAVFPPHWGNIEAEIFIQAHMFIILLRNKCYPDRCWIQRVGDRVAYQIRIELRFSLSECSDSDFHYELFMNMLS